MRELTQFEIEMVSGGADGDSFPEIVVTANMSSADVNALWDLAGYYTDAQIGLVAAGVGVVGVIAELGVGGTAAASGATSAVFNHNTFDALQEQNFETIWHQVHAPPGSMPAPLF